MNKIPASLSVIIAAVSWGVIGFFTRHLESLGFSVLQITFARAFFTFLEITIVILLTNRSLFKVELKDLPLFFATGVISITLFNLCYFYTIQQSTLSIAAILLYTAPCFVVVLSAIFLKQKITKRAVYALILSLFGCILTTGILGSQLSFTPIAILTGILSGLFYGLYSIFGTIILRKYQTPTLVFYAFLFTTIMLVPFINIQEFFRALQNNQILFNCLGISFLSTLIPYYFYSSGLSRMPAAKASIIAFIEPLTSTVVGITCFHEPITLQNITGILFIFIAIVILNTNTKK